MSGNDGEREGIQGSVTPGFESVRELFASEMRTMEERNTQLCVYYRGEKVVDLWSSATGDPRFSPDSIVNVFSSGKSLEAVALAALAGRGLLEYKERIAHYWPEFAAHGKEALTVADLMRHEGGLAAFNTSLAPEDLWTGSLKENRVGRIIEGHPAKFPPADGSIREYHAITRGWVANEIFRRVDPQGRTIGEFYREEISGPLGADVVIGVPEPELDRVSKVEPLGIGFQLLQSLKPKVLGRRIKHSFLQLLRRLLTILPSFRRATTRGAPPPYKGMKGIDFFNERAVAMGETPSAAANCSARGLAKIAAMMASGGTWEGREYVSAEGWRALHADPVEADMGFAATNFTQGGVNCFTAVGPNSTRMERDFNVGREGFYGWMGLGGSIFQWHPEHQIGFGFVPTALHFLDFLNERGKVYQAEVLRCVERAAGR